MFFMKAITRFKIAALLLCAALLTPIFTSCGSVQSEADIPGLVEGGWKQQRLLVGSPRPVTKADLTRIVEQSMKL
jgi:alcohol dehydrogenase class IV